MSQRYIRHITLTTGHTRDSFPGEVSDDVRQRVAELLNSALGRGSPLIPAVPEHTWLTAGATGKGLHACVWAPAPRHIRAAWKGAVPLVTIGVALDSRSGAGWWRRMHEARSPEIVTDPDHPPSAPWCAARLEVGIAWHESAAHWLGDFERVLAWTWYAMRTGTDADV